MPDCIFCRIIRGEIPSKKVFEDERILVIEDVSPQAPTHLLFIPRDHFESCLDMAEGNDATIGYIFRKAGEIAAARGIDKSGFRLVQNNGEGAGQSVFHMHIHLLAGRGFSWPPG